ncbi:MAG: DUF3103 family protein [Bacteroidia bacterium]|nr:DUF3103 family protein [Bacteroidia bacterium]
MERFDNDYDILYAEAMKHPLQTQSKSSSSEVTIRDMLDQNYRKLYQISGFGKDFVPNEKLGKDLFQKDILLTETPLLNIAIPELPEASPENWNTENHIPLVAFVPDEFDEATARVIPAYDSQGKLHWLDAKTPPKQLVIVVAENERVVLLSPGEKIEKSGIRIEDPGCDVPQLEAAPEAYHTNNYHSYYLNSSLININKCGGGGGNTGVTTCTEPYRINDRDEWLTAMKFTDIDPYESWSFGAPEIDVKVYATSNQTNLAQVIEIFGTTRFEPRKRDDINNKWWTINHPIIRWDNAIFGRTWLYWFSEFDPGKTINVSISVAGIPLPGGGTAGGSISIPISRDTKVIGQLAVDQFNCPASRDDGLYYRLNTFRFRSRCNPPL